MLGQVVRYRNYDRVDDYMLKEVITTYVTLGYDNVYIKMDNGVYQWSPTAGNESNYLIYDNYLEIPLKEIIKKDYYQKGLTMISNLSSDYYLHEV